MNINATLLAQVVHFFVAYIIVSRFFLRPLVAVVMQERLYHAQLQETLEEGTTLCVHKNEVQKKQWSMFQETWKKRLPLVSLYTPNESQEFDGAVQQPSPAYVQKNIGAVVAALKAKVDDGV